MLSELVPFDDGVGGSGNGVNAGRLMVQVTLVQVPLSLFVLSRGRARFREAVMYRKAGSDGPNGVGRVSTSND